jgi:type IV pilus assembly protein PilY1
MTAFSTVDPTYRVGFGSINNSARTDVTATGTGNYSSSYNSDYIANARTFGSGSATTDQKSLFWNWIIDLTPGGGTPLQSALDAVGQYYQSTQTWQTSSTDSTELGCRQAYTILTTDGFWNGTVPSGVGDQDGTTGSTITGPNGQSYTYNPYQPYADSAQTQSTSTSTTYAATLSCPSGYSGPVAGICTKTTTPNKGTTRNQTVTCNSGDTASGTTCTHTVTTAGVTYSNTLADVAMKYWRNDLRPNSTNEVPTSSADPAFWQHMVTFTLGLGFAPLYADQATAIPMTSVFNWANGGAAVSSFNSNGGWPQPSANSLNNIADLAHAAVDGHGGF